MGNAQEKANLEETLLKFSSPSPTPPLLKISILYTPTISQCLFLPNTKTCNFLYQESINQAKILKIVDFQDIIALESTDSNEMIDYWLMNPDFSLQKFSLETPLSLKAVYKPKNQLFSDKFHLKDFKFLKCIGKGGTSLVSLVRYMKTGHLFAIKQIPKALLQDPRRYKQIMVERDVLNKLNCPFLAVLISAFESENFLNFLMEYYPGGELFFHLKKVKFTEEIARFYFAQIVFSLEFLHSQKILYRDLKPENLILDLYGYIRLTDFGLCKRGLEDRELTHSFCGSPEYMAPEIFNNAGHSYTVDFYTLGALLYEFTTGLPPFYAKNPREIMENVNKGFLKIPEKLSEDLKDLLRKLLTKNPEERIRDFGGLKQEKWLRDVDWQGIYEKKMETPIQLSVYRSNLHEEFGKIVISSDAMKENQNFKRDYPNFEYFSQKYEGFFESPFRKIHEKSEKNEKSKNLEKTEKSEKRLNSLPANKSIVTERHKSERKQSLKEEKISETSKIMKKYCVKLPLKAKAALTKKNLLMNMTINGPLNRNSSISNIGQLTNRLEKPERKTKLTTITLRSKKEKENINNFSMISPEKHDKIVVSRPIQKKNLVVNKEKIYKKPESLEKNKEKTQLTNKKVNSEKKITSGPLKMTIPGKVTKFLGNKTLLMKNWEVLKENLNATNVVKSELQEKNGKNNVKSYKIIKKLENDIIKHLNNEQ